MTAALVLAALVLAVAVLAAPARADCSQHLFFDALDRAGAALTDARRAPHVAEAKARLRTAAAALEEAEFHLLGCRCLAVVPRFAAAARAAAAAEQLDRPQEVRERLEAAIAATNAAVAEINAGACGTEAADAP